MWLEFENLGPIKNGRIDLGKRLIVFCGENNTGKTYLSYLIYLLSLAKPSIRTTNIESLNKLLGEFKDNNKIEFDLFDLYNENRDAFRKDFEPVINSFPKYNSVDQNYLKDLRLKISNHNINIQIEKESFYRSQGGYYLGNSDATFVVRIDWVAKSTRISITVEKTKIEQKNMPDLIKDWDFMQPIIISSLYSIVYSSLFPQSYFLPSERIGISVFRNELLYNRVQFTNELARKSPEERKLMDPFINSVTKSFSSYPIAIQDAIQNSIRPSFNGSQENLRYLAKDLEEQLIMGEIIESDGEQKLKLKNGKIIEAPLVGSSIKSLSAFIKILKESPRWFIAQILFDEPEMNLHPNNQIILSKTFAKIINLGQKLVLSIHSDYILREFSNLMMLFLKKDDPKSGVLMERYGYKIDELIDPDKVGIYFFSRDNNGIVSIENLDVSKGEIDVKTINKVIQRQMDSSQDISHTLYIEVENESSKQN